MRALNPDEQEQRKKKVLQYVIHEYIRTGKPVGSQAIAIASRLGLSPASIRNTLAALEREEWITHPHTSAGRVPTDKGYRVYVDSLVEMQRLAVQEQVRIRSEYETRAREIEDLMAQTSRMLSSLSHYTGFVMTPKLDQNVFSHMELVPVGPRRILVAMITQSGLSKHFILATQMDIPRERLRAIGRIINENFHGRTLQEVKAGIQESLEAAQQEYRDILSLARGIGEEIKKISTSSEIYMDGASNILALPDIQNAGELHDLFKIIEEKKILANILEKEIPHPGRTDKAAKPAKPAAQGLNLHKVQVRIGSENTVRALQNLSVISSTYRLDENTVGVLGILGPKRMEYSKMIALVDYASQLVNRLLQEFDK